MVMKCMTKNVADTVNNAVKLVAIEAERSEARTKFRKKNQKMDETDLAVKKKQTDFLRKILFQVKKSFHTRYEFEK